MADHQLVSLSCVILAWMALFLLFLAPTLPFVLGSASFYGVRVGSQRRASFRSRRDDLSRGLVVGGEQGPESGFDRRMGVGSLAAFLRARTCERPKHSLTIQPSCSRSCSRAGCLSFTRNLLSGAFIRAGSCETQTHPPPSCWRARPSGQTVPKLKELPTSTTSIRRDHSTVGVDDSHLPTPVWCLG